MSSRNRAARAGAARLSQPSAAEQEIWETINSKIQEIQQAEARSKEVSESIFKLEKTIKDKEVAGIPPTVEELDALGALYRENVSLANNSADIIRDAIIEPTSVLQGLVTHNEATQEAKPARTSASRDSRPALETFDGPSDSPGPSSAENKHIRKATTGRTSSQPPRDRDEKDDREPSNSSRPKVFFAMGAEVAFKPKIPGATEEHDWIQGIVTKVIGEGKSRRYDVQDPFPDEQTGKPGESYRSSASSMVPIPASGTVLQDYEVGKRVLALYPETTTFYRADVKAMLDGGAKVQLLFEDEPAGLQKIVDRRFVLDHKG